jgi:beta-mannanase
VTFLKSITGQFIVAGQHNDQKDGTDENHYTERVQQITGKRPGLYGADFLFHGSSSLRWAITYEAERQWNQGALVSLMWHACPPTQGASCQWDGGLLSHLTDSQWNDLITDGGHLNGVWKARIDEISVYLQYLEDRGVEVLWRPLHEQNQGAFWWGGRTGSNGTRRLFQLTHDYMTKQKGLSNLVWVWDVQDLSTDYGNYNPGASYFDIAALDIYGGGYSNNAYYDSLVQQAGSAPVAIGECFGLPPEWALANQPRHTFFMNWAYGLEVDWNGNPTNSIPFIREVYANPRVITLDEMPGWD